MAVSLKTHSVFRRSARAAVQVFSHTAEKAACHRLASKIAGSKHSPWFSFRTGQKGKRSMTSAKPLQNIWGLPSLATLELNYRRNLKNLDLPTLFAKSSYGMEAIPGLLWNMTTHVQPWLIRVCLRWFEWAIDIVVNGVWLVSRIAYIMAFPRWLL